jgi:hypothetical protein
MIRDEYVSVLVWGSVWRIRTKAPGDRSVLLAHDTDVQTAARLEDDIRRPRLTGRADLQGLDLYGIVRMGHGDFITSRLQDP